MIAQIQIPEDLKEIFESLKGFFASKNMKYETTTEEGSILIKFEEPMELEQGEYEEFLDLIKGLNFFEVNGAENQINNFIGYKDWIGVVEFETWDGEIKMYIDYSKASMRGQYIYYIKEIIIERRNLEAQEEE